jgi:hypothetical protein
MPQTTPANAAAARQPLDALAFREAAPSFQFEHAAPRTQSLPPWRRLAHIGTGHALYAAFNWGFDNVLYVYVVYTLGMVTGGALMTALSGIQCAATLLVYQRMRIDWVGSGWLAEIRRKPRRSRLESLLVWAGNGHPVLLFTLLCVFQDPFMATAWFRHGSFERLTRRDWSLFGAAVLVSNLYWICVASVIGQVVVAAWRQLSALWEMLA